jgi:hypothetical protein
MIYTLPILRMVHNVYISATNSIISSLNQGEEEASSNKNGDLTNMEYLIQSNLFMSTLI